MEGSRKQLQFPLPIRFFAANRHSLLDTGSMTGGVFLVEKMRNRKAVASAESLRSRYDRCVGLLQWLPAVCSEVFRTAAVLAALGERLRRWRPFSRPYAYRDLRHCSCHI